MLPNVIIGGAPKCGTTSVFNWLTDHPEVCGSKIKETCYLMDKGDPLCKKHSNYHDHGMKGYRSYFDHCHKLNSKIILEATPHYLYQKTALEVLSDMETLPQIIFILRKPSDRVFSAYRYYQNNMSTLNKNVSFPKFILMVNNEKFKEDPVLHNIIKYSQYVDYLSLWVKRCGSRVHVFLFEDMKKNPQAIMKSLSKIINIDPAFFDCYNFTLKNESISVKNQFLQRMAVKYEKYIHKGSLRNFLKNFYFKSNSQKVIPRKNEEDRLMLSELDTYFLPFNKKLADAFNIDISTWE